jgi:ribosomal-protein-alanine N-acetyltransferase
MSGWLSRLFAPATTSIEPASMRDAAKLSQLHRASFHRGWGQGEFETMLAERNTFTQRLMLGRTLIGFIISRLAADEAEILSVAVAASHRERGYSSELVANHLGHLAGRGIRRVFLEVEENNTPAVRLYQRVGFTTVGRREQYYRDASGAKLNALVMQRDLS